MNSTVITTSPSPSPNAAKKTFIFIDGSYYCFHRYYSVMRWWKNAHPDEPLNDPMDTPAFLDTFTKTFVNNILNIPKNLNIDKKTPVTMVVGKDCKREDIWRNEFIDKYKGTRLNGPEHGFMGGPFFKMAYDTGLFEKGGVSVTLKHPKLEGDDCIAIYVKYLLKKYKDDVSIYIITSDKDYLQLIEPRVKIFNLSFKNIAENKSCFGDAKKDLFCKIVMGDVSDNIPSVLSKCGPKTAVKCYDDRNYFDERMKKENAYAKWENNQRIIDFDYIPSELVEDFMKTAHVL